MRRYLYFHRGASFLKVILSGVILFGLCSGMIYCEDVSVVMVGDKVVLENDIRAKMRDENKDYQEALRDIVSEKLLLLQAEREGIEVTKEEVDSEINRIMKRFPDEKAFFSQLEKEKIPYQLFRKQIEEKVKVKKLIRKNVVDKLVITTSEILKKMKEIEEKSSNAYKVKMKWFNDEASSKDFASSFNDTKEEEMTDVGWMNSEEILPQVLEPLEKIGKGKLSAPIKINNRYLILLLKDINKRKPDAYTLYNRAKNALYNIKFSEKFNAYLRELQSRTPVFYSN